MAKKTGKILAISGGIGGAKLALGLDGIVEEGELCVVANTGDDFEHMGLSVSPDIDTLLYTLSGLNNEQLGWGRRDESWNFIDTCEELGLDTWFKLGDRDLALHIYRSMELSKGRTLSEITLSLCDKFKIKSRVIPMSDSPVRTVLETNEGLMPFQHYFVKHRCEPTVTSVQYEGANTALASPYLIDFLESPDLRAVIICPSNPFLSIAPVLAVADIKQRLMALSKPIVLVSPIIEGESIKGPTSKLMREMGMECSVTSVSEFYLDIASHIVIDHLDEKEAAKIHSRGLQVECSNILMNTIEDKRVLAQFVLDNCAG